MPFALDHTEGRIVVGWEQMERRWPNSPQQDLTSLPPAGKSPLEEIFALSNVSQSAQLWNKLFIKLIAFYSFNST